MSESNKGCWGRWCARLMKKKHNLEDENERLRGWIRHTIDILTAATNHPNTIAVDWKQFLSKTLLEKALKGKEK